MKTPKVEKPKWKPTDACSVVSRVGYHYAQAAAYAEYHLEFLARDILRNNRQDLKEFANSMGIYSFTDHEDNLVDVSENDPRFRDFVKFYTAWHNMLGGMPMRFTAKGKKITKW